MSIVSVTKKVRFCNNYGFDFSIQTSEAQQENFNCLQLPTEGKWSSDCGLFSNSVCVFDSVTDATHLGDVKRKNPGCWTDGSVAKTTLAALADNQGFVPSTHMGAQNHL